MKLITRAQAIKEGKKRYFTGKPCKYGHLSEKFTAQGRCCVCNEISQKKYLLKIRKNKIWISVEDGLPEHAEDVLVFTKNESYSLGHYFYGDGWSLEEDTIVTDYVTHWMKLPAPPEI